ncbi:phenylacetate--CoA ligase family protein [Streptomyces sp. NBC_01508]|uniref:phenylacetate--CoA ligase family protein n=1 Tax=Streptomyces sp. NBC_01508 TaxID=2903888 RepID=UPI00386919B4
MTNSTTTALAELLDHARRYVPYYQRLIPQTPVTLDNAVAVLRRLPLLQRDKVRRERPRLWSTEGDPLRWRTVHTTGTTGSPLEIVVDEAAQRAELASLIRHVESHVGARTGFAILHLTLHLASVSRTSVAPEPPNTRLSKWNLSRAWQLPDEEFSHAVEELAGQVITAMPSVMAALCDRLGRWPGRLAPPRLVVLSGEHVTPGVRARVAQTFGCHVTALYTLAEAGIVGHECGETGNYHVDETGAFLEVIGDGGLPLSSGVPGDIAVTPLANHAMPLIRYLTGDTGVWVDGPCDCARSGPRLRLLMARSEHVLVTGPSGRGLRMIDLAKLCRQLDLGVTRVVREGDEVVLEHRDERPASNVQRTVVAAALRSLLGVELTVRTLQVPRVLTVDGPQAEAPRRAGVTDVERPGVPALPAPGEIAAWARKLLAGEGDVLAVALTGSALDPASVSRFSDIDMTIVVDGDPYGAYWRSRATAMNRHVATLRVNVTQAAAVARTPLVACRLLSERHAVLGSLEQAGVAWPAAGALVAEGMFWAQTAENILWTRLTSADRTRTDPLRDAWLASRFCLDALRYKFLCEGIRVTAARSILRLVVESGVPNATGITNAFAVGREHRPPPMAGTPEADQFLLDALSCVRWLGNFW